MSYKEFKNAFHYYKSILISMTKTSIIADMEYRSDFVLKIFTDVIWYVSRIALFEVLYFHTKTIGTWDIHQMRVFLGVAFITDAISEFLFAENLYSFVNKVVRGDLDLLLAKPVNSQFMMSFQKISSTSLGSLLIGLGYLTYSLLQLHDFNWSHLFWLLLLVPNSVCIIYFFRFCLASTSIIFTKADNLQFLWINLYKISLRPDFMYTKWLRTIILTIFPVALIASVPSRILVEPVDASLILWTLFVGPLLVYLSNIYWRFCLRFYTSASS